MYKKEENYRPRNELASPLDEYKKQLKEAKRKRNVAACMDIAKGVLSIIARNKDVRYNVVPPPKSSSAAKAYDEAQERYRKALVDYNGKIASSELKYPKLNTPLTSISAQQQPQRPEQQSWLFRPISLQKKEPSFTPANSAAASWLDNYKPKTYRNK